MARRGRIGAYRQHGLYDTRETTRAARDKRWAAYLRQADPEGVLDDVERERRARALRQADMLKLTAPHA
jgi:hypothetical protein